MSTPATESIHPKPTGTPRRTIILLAMCTVLNAAAQILMKNGSAHFSANLMEQLTNYPLLGGYALYGAFTVLMVVALREGELSMLYPIISLSYVWVAILSYTLLGEKPTTLKTIGIVIIVFGVAVLGRGGRK